MILKTFKIPCSRPRIDLEICLKNGQAFRWRKNSEQTLKTDQKIITNKVETNPAKTDEIKIGETYITFQGFIANYPVKLYQTKTELTCEFDSNLSPEENLKNDVLEYFYLNTEHDLSKMKTDWNSIKYSHIDGCNILKQEPFETILSFICSQNNNISRITSMIDKLCENYGEKVEFTDSFKFPKPEKLIDSEDDLREMKFGYRAKYISGTCKFIYENGGYDENGDLTWIENLKNMDYPEAKLELLKLPGVGPKVADCICLFSLEKHHVVPIDTHVWQIAVRDFGYKAKGTGKGLSKTEYNTVQKFLYDKWGEHAGWLQQILFTKEIKADSPGKRKKMEEHIETGKAEKTEESEVGSTKQEVVIVKKAVIPTQTDSKKIKKLKIKETVIKETDIKQEFQTVSSSKSSKNEENCECHFCTRISTEH